MKRFNVKHAAVAALIGLAHVSASPQAWAGIGDYEFQLVQGEIKQGDATVIAVRLIDKRSGKPVPNAVIFAQRLDMSPDGMEMMTAPIEPLASTEPGVYRFMANLMMSGGWRLSLGAKVQGETDTLENKLEFQAVP